MEFKPGQLWSYATRPGERTSRITVCHVEFFPELGEVVHIYVDGLRIAHPKEPGTFIGEIGHLPYASSALSTCVVTLVGAADRMPVGPEGYTQWRVAFDAGEAGVWTVPVAEAVSCLAEAMTNAHRQPESD